MLTIWRKNRMNVLKEFLGNRVVKIKKLIVLGMIMNQELHLKVYQF